MAVGFKTGSHSKDYTLTSIRAALSNAVPADGVRVRLFSTSPFGIPETSLLTFDNPAISNGTKTFTAPANTTLPKDTQYFLVFDSTATGANYRVGATESDSLTSQVAGWELNASRHFTLSGGSWTEHYATVRVEINGTIKPNATGQPGITGLPQAGESLTATIGDITDADGLPAFPSGFTFQWVRVDGTTETDIPGATSSTYVPVAADVGKQVKVKVSYTDNDGAAEGPLESDPTDDAVLAARAPCPSRSDLCAGMTVRHATGPSVPLELGGGSYGSLDDLSFEYGTYSYVVNAVWLLMDPLSGTNAVAVTLDAFVPRGSVFHIGGAEFIADASSRQSGTGQYKWPAPPGLSWIEGQKVTFSVRFRRPFVTIEATKTEAVYGAENIGFTVTRDGGTDGPLNVDVVLTDYQGHLPDSALSRAITIPDGAGGAGFTIEADEFKDLDDGSWLSRPGAITGKIVKRSWYKRGSPSSVRVKMQYAMTVGFDENSYRVDEGSGSLDVTFRATTGEGMGAPTKRVEVRFSTAAGSATSPEDFTSTSGSFFFEPEDFKCLPGGYDGCVLTRDDHRAMKTVTLTHIIEEDNLVEGDETFRLLVLHEGSSNGPEVVYVDSRGIRGVTCTPGSTCAAEVTIVDNDGDFTEPAEHPDWTLEGDDRTFAGTSTNRPPAFNGAEPGPDVRCLNSSTPFRLLDHNGDAISAAEVEYSFRQIPGRDVAQYPGLPKPSEMLTQFTIDDSGQVRTVVGKSYLHYEDSLTQLRYTDVIVRALHTTTNRYAEYRMGFNIVHPSRTDKVHLSPPCSSMQVAPPEPLTAELREVPASHDGSTAFSFELAFSDPVDIEPDAMRDHALVVSDGTVTGASRVDGRSDLWELTVEPAGTANVGIIVPQGRACTEEGALCTRDGRTLSSTVPAQIVQYVPPGQERHAPGARLTASFENAPASHDGASVFTLELAFSEAVFTGDEPFDKNQRIADAISVKNGVLKGRRRSDPQQYDRWVLRIVPSGHGDVRLRLPETTGGCSAAGAICTPGGTALSGDTTATIEGPGRPELSIADAEVEEAPGARLVFTITLSQAATQTVTFDIATSDGSAIAGEDYRAKDTTRSMAQGTTSRVFKVPVHDDAHNEGDETMTVTISNVSGATLVDGTATGTIQNTDPMPSAATVRIAREIGSQLVEAVSSRADGGAGTHLTVGGLSLTGGATVEEPDAARPLGLPEWNSRQALDSATRTMTREQLLHDSAFSVSSGSAVAGGPTFAAWGHVASTRFDAEEDDIILDGRVTTGLLAGEVERERLLAGIIVSHSRGDGGFKGEHGIAGEFETSLTGTYPYARVDLNERVAAWVLAGGGAGELTLRSEGHRPIETDMSMRMGAVGLKGQLLAPTEPGGLAVNLRSDAMWVRAETERVNGLVATAADATRLRAIVEAERAYETGTGATVTPTGQVGIRLDGGDAETGAGLELGAGLRYRAGALSIEGQVRGLVAHEDSGYREWGASAAVRVEPRQGGRGLSLSVAPVWGEAASQSERLWSARDARELDPSRAFEPEARLEAEVGYGLRGPHASGLVTPYAGLTLAGEGARTIRTGTRWDLAPGAALGLEGTRAADDGNTVEVRLQVAW